MGSDATLPLALVPAREAPIAPTEKRHGAC
jgi:hypothetical protein